MKYHIVKSFGKYVVCEAKVYSLPLKREKNQKGSFNIFNEKLPDISYTLTHQELRYVSGEAITCEMSYKECLTYCKSNNLELIQIPLHSTFLTELDSRTFRK